jgi:hypothetical protein
MTQKMNETMVAELLENLSKEEAIIAIANAITNRDKKIAMIEKELAAWKEHFDDGNTMFDGEDLIWVN